MGPKIILNSSYYGLACIKVCAVTIEFGSHVVGLHYLSPGMEEKDLVQRKSNERAVWPFHCISNIS
jgi:hypothetical protein